MLRHTLFKNKPLYSTLARRTKLAINFFVPCSKAISSSTSLPIGVALMTSPFPKVLCCTISPVLNTFPPLAGGVTWPKCMAAVADFLRSSVSATGILVPRSGFLQSCSRVLSVSYTHLLQSILINELSFYWFHASSKLAWEVTALSKTFFRFLKIY